MARASGRLIGEELGREIGTIPLEPLPGFLATLLEDPEKGRAGHNEAARPTAFTGVDDRKGSGRHVHGRPHS
jgi:hypothetical protein